MKELILRRLNKEPMFAQVDDALFSTLNQQRWHVLSTPAGNYVSNGKNNLLLHRYIMELKLGRTLTRKEEIDHVDGNGLNNQCSNLRVCNSSQNSLNTRMHKDNIIGFKGITYDTPAKTWTARICVNYENIRSHKIFDNPEDAAKEYDLLAIKYAGRFARLNFEDRRQEYIDVVNAGWEPTPAREHYSAFKYVSYNKEQKHQKNPWSAACYEGGKRLSIGYFPSEELAAIDADIFVLNRYGDKADLNFPQSKTKYVQMLQDGYKPGTKRVKSSQYTGVNFQKNKKIKPWRSYIEKNGKRKYFGDFATEQDAYEAREEWIRRNP